MLLLLLLPFQQHIVFVSRFLWDAELVVVIVAVVVIIVVNSVGYN